MNTRVAGWAVLTLIMVLVGGSLPAQADAPAGPITIRPQYKEGMALAYHWKMAAKTGWLPAQQGVDFVAGETDFVFTLAGKTLRDDGSMTFRVLGDTLHAKGESNKGRIGVEATAKQARLLLNNSWFGPSNNTPLAHEITITLGSRFEGKLGTGLEHIAPYFLPSIDHTFWSRLTEAPEAALTVGQAGEKSFEWPLPGTSSKPVDVKAAWKVEAPRLYRGQRVLPIRLAAKLELDNTPAVLANGDKINLKHAVYEAEGVAYWHLEKGILCYAEAQEKCAGFAAAPDQRKIAHLATSTLELINPR